ncbi:MAG: dihydroxy-acid dehydratase [Actinobacteria bacterium]|nr:dihydroxy-acid dehydratase [Actinomycetota bacterium]
MSDDAIGVDRGLTSYGDAGFSRYLRRAFLAAAGYDRDDLARPVVGIGHTISDYVPCHRQMPEIVKAVERGVLQAGGIPFSFPLTALGEPLLSPTSMLYRNLAAMQAEELVRAQPLDSVVFVGGCDKTVPAQMLAAVSAGRPALLEVTGPMLSGRWRGQRMGACTDCRRTWGEHRAGRLSNDEIDEVEQALAPTAGTCMVMGTASTMACLTESLGLMLPGGATAPAPTGARLRHAVQTGRRAVELARAPASETVVCGASLRNALIVLAAIGGSTNALVHLVAVARRAGLDLTLRDVGPMMDGVPLLVDCKPTGTRYLEDFEQAGGLPVLLKALEPLLDTTAATARGDSLAELLARVEPPAPWQDVIGTLDAPKGPPGTLVVLAGSLAPNGAVIKAGAASPPLLHHTGPAVVFESPDDALRLLDDSSLEITAEHVLVLRNAGPVGAAMPEAGSLPLPKRLLAAGVRDMVRVSDARMSGTAEGTVVLHCAPEAAIGGPLALVRDGDLVRLDVAAGAVDLLVEERQLEKRRASWSPPALAERGWLRLHQQHSLGADLGADLDFLVPPATRR